MKTSEFVDLLKAKGCYLHHHGTNHDAWVNPKSGRMFFVPRHGSKELTKGLVKKIMKEAGL